MASFMEFIIQPWVLLFLIFAGSAITLVLVKNLWPLYVKELYSVLFSPIVYIFSAVFLVVVGHFFANYVGNARLADYTPIQGLMGFILLFFIPAITMRLFAEETRSGTLETLMTAPVTDAQVVLAKFFAALTFYCIMLVPTLVHVITLEFMSSTGTLDYGWTGTGYLGLVLMGIGCIPIGLFFSSLTRNQIIAFASTLTVLLLLYALGFAVSEKKDTAKAVTYQILSYASMQGHTEGFIRGISDTRHIIYFLGGGIYFLFLTTLSVESRKWR